MKANHTSQKYKLEDNIAKHYPQQIAILKERISGMTADIQTAKTNLPADKEKFFHLPGIAVKGSFRHIPENLHLWIEVALP